MGWFPNPISWVFDKAGGLLAAGASSVLGWSFDKVIGGLVAWVLDGVAWAVGAIFGFISASTSPNVTAAWFVGDSSHAGPYRVMVGVAAVLLLVFVFAGIIQGVLTGDTAGMLRRVAVDLPFAIGGMVGLVALTQLLIEVTDQLTAGILANFGDDIGRFMGSVATVGTLTGGVATALVVFLLGLGTLLAALVIFIELVIRAALIYLVVGLCPLAFAALLWPVTRGVLRRTLELLAALIISKVVIALALAIGAAALGGTGATTPAPTPTLAAPGAPTLNAPSPVVGSDAATVTAAAGVLLAGLATFTVACFSPFVVLRLFPVVESAVVAQGLRGSPLRASQQAMGVHYQLGAARRFGQGPTPDASAGAGPGTGAGAGAAGGAAGPAAPGATAAGAAAAVAAAGGQRATTAAASQAAAAQPQPQPQPAPSSAASRPAATPTPPAPRPPRRPNGGER